MTEAHKHWEESHTTCCPLQPLAFLCVKKELQGASNRAGRLWKGTHVMVAKTARQAKLGAWGEASGESTDRPWCLRWGRYFATIDGQACRVQYSVQTAQVRIWVQYKLLKLKYCTAGMMYVTPSLELAREDAEFLLGFRTTAMRLAARDPCKNGSGAKSNKCTLQRLQHVKPTAKVLCTCFWN